MLPQYEYRKLQNKKVMFVELDLRPYSQFN